jgi:hypothetical protein
MRLKPYIVKPPGGVDTFRGSGSSRVCRGFWGKSRITAPQLIQGKLSAKETIDCASVKRISDPQLEQVKDCDELIFFLPRWALNVDSFCVSVHYDL